MKDRFLAHGFSEEQAAQLAGLGGGMIVRLLQLLQQYAGNLTVRALIISMLPELISGNVNLATILKDIAAIVEAGASPATPAPAPSA